ncbi:MAG: hypothetical protein AAGA61_06055 [Pseudomonadota bacterium]
MRNDPVRTWCRPLLVVLATTFGTALAASELDGAYERVSLTNTRTGASPEAANRQGLLILANGHYSMMTMNPDRRSLADDAVAALSAEEEIAYLREWLDINGHTGRFEAQDGELTWYRDLSENPREVGTVSKLGYEWRDGLLVIFFTLPNGDRYDWVWRPVVADTD